MPGPYRAAGQSPQGSQYTTTLQPDYYGKSLIFRKSIRILRTAGGSLRAPAGGISPAPAGRRYICPGKRHYYTDRDMNSRMRRAQHVAGACPSGPCGISSSLACRSTKTLPSKQRRPWAPLAHGFFIQEPLMGLRPARRGGKYPGGIVKGSPHAKYRVWGPEPRAAWRWFVSRAPSPRGARPRWPRHGPSPRPQALAIAGWHLHRTIGKPRLPPPPAPCRTMA